MLHHHQFLLHEDLVFVMEPHNIKQFHRTLCLHDALSTPPISVLLRHPRSCLLYIQQSLYFPFQFTEFFVLAWDRDEEEATLPLHHCTYALWACIHNTIQKGANVEQTLITLRLYYVSYCTSLYNVFPQWWRPDINVDLHVWQYFLKSHCNDNNLGTDNSCYWWVPLLLLL